MSKRGRELFDSYIMGLLAEADHRNAELEIIVEKLKAAAEATDIRVSEIEDEVGKLQEAIQSAMQRKGKQEREGGSRTEEA